jgi:large subunit ribosomal protein L6
MSRVGKLPITVPAKVEVTLAANEITVKGPLGTLKQAATGLVNIKKDGDKLVLEAANDTQVSNAMSGTMRALIANMVQGVEKGFERKLTLVGVGYKAAAQGNKLNLALGYSHPVVHDLPEGVTATTPTPTEIILKGVDKQKVGQVAAIVRGYRPPEPYKGKGVRYSDEVIVLKETKKK